MPEKVKEQPAESTADQQEEAKDVPEADKDKETHEAGSSNGAQEQDGAEADLAKTDKQAEGDAPKRRGRKPKQSGEGPETKKPKKETKTPERVSSRVRNRSVGEKLPAFKDMEDLPSPTKRKSKGDAKEDEKPATNEGEQVKATA